MFSRIGLILKGVNPLKRAPIAKFSSGKDFPDNSSQTKCIKLVGFEREVNSLKEQQTKSEKERFKTTTMTKDDDGDGYENRSDNIPETVLMAAIQSCELDEKVGKGDETVVIDEFRTVNDIDKLHAVAKNDNDKNFDFDKLIEFRIPESCNIKFVTFEKHKNDAEYAVVFNEARDAARDAAMDAARDATFDGDGKIMRGDNDDNVDDEFEHFDNIGDNIDDNDDYDDPFRFVDDVHEVARKLPPNYFDFHNIRVQQQLQQQQQQQLKQKLPKYNKFTSADDELVWEYYNKNKLPVLDIYGLIPDLQFRRHEIDRFDGELVFPAFPALQDEFDSDQE